MLNRKSVFLTLLLIVSSVVAQQMEAPAPPSP
jgi:hypothetical protein